MENNFNMDCGDIREKLKAFLDDLLVDDEYQAFVNHLNSCGKCKDYVRKIGSISNQLWELGDVDAPSDLSSTILFRLKQAEQEIRKPKFVISKKLNIRILVGILALSILFFGTEYFKYRCSLREVDETPVLTTIIERRPAINNYETELLSEDLKGIAKTRGLPEKKEAAGGIFEERVSTEKTSALADSSDMAEVQIVEPKPLHWHFIYSEDTEKTKLLDMISILGIRPDYQDSSLLVFNVKGAELDNLLEQIKFAFQRRNPLYNYTAGTAAFQERESRVSMYLENKKDKPSNIFHWHIFSAVRQRPKLLNIIRKTGVSVDYESRELIIFSIARTEIAKLKSRIQTMVVSADVVFTEFGYLEPEEDQPASKLAKISIYFSKKR